MKKNGIVVLIFVMFLIVSCAGIPDGFTAVKDFEAEKYLGKWYEIARFDFTFEKDLNNTTAEYSWNKDGSVRVVNRGFNYVKNTPEEAVGKAKFRGDPSIAELKVSFFGPFYAGYNVIALDTDYQYALVAGDSLDYLWILSRTKTMPEDIKQSYVDIAQTGGFDTSRFIWVEHD